MKNAWRVQAAFVVVSGLTVVGCDSTQPDRIETRSASVSFETKALVEIWDCYETPFRYCFASVVNGVQEKASRPLPWNYSLKITVIRSGTVEEVVAISPSGTVGSSIERGDSVNDFVSLTDYDPNQPPAPDRNEGGTIFSGGKKVSTGSPIYLAFIAVDPGIPNTLDVASSVPNTPATFDFSLNTGDTVIVRARKQAVALSPAYSPRPTEIKLSAFLAVSGVPVAVQGPTTSPTDDKAGFTFSFTVQ